MIDQDTISIARNVFTSEIDALRKISDDLGDDFITIAEEIKACKGNCVLTGMGKSGHIARKVAATLSSLGTPAFFLHPAEAVHGDLGSLKSDDVVILLSNSGETREVISLIPSLRLLGTKMIGITGNGNSTLAKECDLTQVLTITGEAGTLGLAPTVSTTAMLVYGDALAITIAEKNGFTSTDFGKYHPAGTLGKRVLMRVYDIMAVGGNIPLVKYGCKIADAIMEMSKKGLGVVAISNDDGELVGILTDGDLRRALEKKKDLYNGIVDEIMTENPKSISSDLLLVDVLQRLRDSHLNNYPVVDEKKRVVGMLTWQMIIRQGIGL